jgi:hypothetical protein
MRIGKKQDEWTDLRDQIMKVPLAPMPRSFSIGWLSMPEMIISCNLLSPKPAANMFEPGRDQRMGQRDAQLRRVSNALYVTLLGRRLSSGMPIPGMLKVSGAAAKVTCSRKLECASSICSRT